MSKNSFKNISFIASIIALGLIASCSPPEKKISIKDPNSGDTAEVTVSGGLFSKDINIKNTKEGSSVDIVQGKMPSTMPSFISLYPGASQITSVQANGQSGGKEGMNNNVSLVSFKSSDDPVKIIDFYTNELSNHGYSKEASVNMGSTQMATLKNSSNDTSVQIMIADDHNKQRMVQLIYASKY